ncbi:hypothetical protein O4H52_03045 [Sphingomonadaceae bacterium G21617-S1]|nr:hypothetical protein [Sphingomonadaceae bacterium G21617-S1]
MEYFWIKYRRLDGQPVGNGHSASRSEVLNQADEAHAVIEVDEDATAKVPVEINGQVFEVNVPSLDVVRRTFARRIDQAALERTADPFASDHAMKLAEARAFLFDRTEPTPMLDAEAGAAGTDIDTLAPLVIERAEAATAHRIAVNAKRIAAKQAIEAAQNVPAIVAAGVVDWEVE